MNAEGTRKIFEKIDKESGEVWWRFGGREGCVKISEKSSYHHVTRILSVISSFHVSFPRLAPAFSPRCSPVQSTQRLVDFLPFMPLLWGQDLSPSPSGLAYPIPTHSLFPSCMARDHLRRCLQQQVRQPRCPSCGKRFADIVRHLNHRQSKCADWFNTANPPRHHHLPSHHSEDLLDSSMDPPPSPENLSSTPLPPSPHQLHTHVEFPGAARIYGQAKTFMDKFADDQFSGFRATNVHYPFSGKNEWELASFLLSSGLSMRKVDEFLQLKMVSS